MTPRITPCSAFSLLEALVVVAVLGLVASVVVPSILEGPNAAKKAKLEQDVVIVNNAIDSYIAAGGSQGALTAGGIIEALKQRVGGGVTQEMTGPLGPFLDPRVVTNATDFAWSARLDTSGSRPRFVVEKSSNGIVFARGVSSLVGGPTASAEPSWLWSYDNTPAAPVTRTVFEPGLTEDGTTLGITNMVVIKLSPPVIGPSNPGNLMAFPLPLSISNPNPGESSIVYYRIGDNPWTLWVGSINIDPGVTVTAQAISIDPSRYSNSDFATQNYNITPLALSVTVDTGGGNITYAQAGGTFWNQNPVSPRNARILLNNQASIPAKYLNSDYISIRYSLNGVAANDPYSFRDGYTPKEIPLAVALWGSGSTLTISAEAVSLKTDWFTSSGPDEKTVNVTPTPLPVTVAPANPVGLPPFVRMTLPGPVPMPSPGVFPTFHYRTDGAEPLATGGSASVGGAIAGSALVATLSNLSSTTYTFTAQAKLAGLEQWFSSPMASATYRTITSLPSEFVGANISGGDVNGSFTGSIFVSAPANLGIFNAGGQITGGNLYVPGLPAIEIPGSGNSTKTAVARGQAYVEQGEIPRTLVGGKEFSADGQLADPQLDTRQVVDLNGALTPTNYTVKLTKSAYIEGKIYRRADPPPVPAVPVVPNGLPVYTNTISGAFTNAILSGVYSNRITMNNTNSVLRLGTPGSTSQYVFAGNTWSKGTVEVLGPVEIFFLDGFDNKGVVFGSSNNIVVGSTASLRINVMTNAVDISGGGSVFASLWAANSAVTVGNASFFYGSLYAQTLTVSPGGTVKVD